MRQKPNMATFLVPSVDLTLSSNSFPIDTFLYVFSAIVMISRPLYSSITQIVYVYLQRIGICVSGKTSDNCLLRSSLYETVG